MVSVTNLSKQYRIGATPSAKYQTFRDLLSFSRKKRKSPAHTRDFWALRHLNFEVKQGEVVGLIGRNGAGKSTLLKLLSRITEPSEGQIRIRGRVASLLEVGTGFHGELSGRENIFLNGAILGMHRAEIRMKFDEIVHFAEVESFIDTPVKHYSSGMYVKLAFSVAAHLETEVLLIDEVLAVGDMAFQKKCLGRIGTYTQSGRTVFLVSHNLSQIQAHCQRGILLKSGHIEKDGAIGDVVKRYLDEIQRHGTYSHAPHPEGIPTLTYAEVTEENNRSVELHLRIHSKAKRTTAVEIRFMDLTGASVAYASLGVLDSRKMVSLESGETIIKTRFSTQHMALGTYHLSIALTQPAAECFDRVQDCLSFEISHPPVDGTKEVMQQSWGYGSWEVPLEILS